jgi:hypothetical protein
MNASAVVAVVAGGASDIGAGRLVAMFWHADKGLPGKRN